MQHLSELPMAELEACYKAIAKYLEYKRDVFPRFYFISPDDLLAVIARSAPDAAASVRRPDPTQLLRWPLKSKPRA